MSFCGCCSTARTDCVAAERALLDGVPNTTISDVPCGNGQTIHTVTVELNASSTDVLVMLPGYGLGPGSFAMTLEELAASSSKSPFCRCHALDWPGTGLSSPFTPEAPPMLAELITFAVKALAAWQRAIGVERITLLGHSLGAYLACHYAETHPTAVGHLVLASPFGLPLIRSNEGM